MVEMALAKIKIDERNEGQVIVLKEKHGKRFLPIIIGIAEVAAIKRKISGIEPPRPMTHDLLIDTISTLGAKVQKIIIDKLELSTFHAKIILKPNKARTKTITIDARPSDSIAVALRADVPIFVEEKVFDSLQTFENQPFL